MNYYAYFLFCVLFVACNNESQPNYIVSNDNSQPEDKIDFDRERDGYKRSDTGLFYVIHEDKGEAKAKINDYLVADLSYSTESGHKIFSKKDLTFKFTRSLFSGALNEGLQMMGKGDKASFIIQSDKVYIKSIPEFVKEGEGIKYDVTLHNILDKRGYDNLLRTKNQSSKPKRK